MKVTHCNFFQVYKDDISKYIVKLIGMKPWKMSLKFQRNFLERNTGRAALLLCIRPKLHYLHVQNLNLYNLYFNV